MLKPGAEKLLTTAFPVVKPNIESGDVYLFTSGSGMRYEVRFGRKKENILHINVAFGVLNEEFGGEEYSVTNKGELYRVLATVVSIIGMYVDKHPHVRELEFTGEGREDEKSSQTKRAKLYHRYASRIVSDDWAIETVGSKIIIRRKRLGSSSG